MILAFYIEIKTIFFKKTKKFENIKNFFKNIII